MCCDVLTYTEDSLVSYIYVAQHIASCSYCTLSVHSTHAMSEHTETVPEHMATQGSLLHTTVLGVIQHAVGLCANVWCYAARQRS